MLRETHADALVSAPSDFARSRENFRSDDELKDVGDAGRVRHLQTRSGVGEVANDAIGGMGSVECYRATFEGALPLRLTIYVRQYATSRKGVPAARGAPTPGVEIIPASVFYSGAC